MSTITAGDFLKRTPAECRRIYLSDNKRYAELMNGIGCNGRQAVGSADLYEIDTQTGAFFGRDFIGRLSKSEKRGSIKNRDAIRKAAFGVNLAVTGVESQSVFENCFP